MEQRPDFQVEVRKTEERLLSAFKLLEADSDGFSLLQTPRGDYWVPPNGAQALAHVHAEQDLGIYSPSFLSPQTRGTILDIGANVGVFARNALKAGAHMVVAVEPSQDNLRCLRVNLANEISQGLVDIVPNGVWHKEATLPIRLNLRNPAAHTFVLESTDSVGGSLIKLTTVDNILESLSLPAVSLIKMDIEGAEVNALRGARKTLVTFAPALCIAAYHQRTDARRLRAQVCKLGMDYETIVGPYSTENGNRRPEILYFLKRTHISRSSEDLGLCCTQSD